MLIIDEINRKQNNDNDVVLNGGNEIWQQILNDCQKKNEVNKIVKLTGNCETIF